MFRKVLRILLCFFIIVFAVSLVVIMSIAIVRLDYSQMEALAFFGYSLILAAIVKILSHLIVSNAIENEYILLLVRTIIIVGGIISFLGVALLTLYDLLRDKR